MATGVKAAASAAAKAAKAAAKAAKEAAPKAPRPQAGLLKPLPVSPMLKNFVGSSTGEISRAETIKKVWAYIKEKNLQDPAKKSVIVCDDTLKQLFADREQVQFLEIPGLLSPHFIKKDQS